MDETVNILIEQLKKVNEENENLNHFVKPMLWHRFNVS